MKVLLVNPPWRKNGYYGVRAGAKWPHLIPYSENGNRRSFVPFPFHLAYAASVLKNKGHIVYVIDAVASELDDVEFYARVMDAAPDIIVQEVSTPTLVIDLNYAQEMKRICDRAKLVFCGPNLLMQDEKFLEANSFVDFVIYGEYEYVLRNLINELERDNPSLGIIDGLIYREKGRIIKNPPAQLISDIDLLPWPARDLFPLEKYGNDIFELPKPSLQVMTGRGCPYLCSFCLWPIEMYGSNVYRVRKPKDVAEEIAYCSKKWNIKSYFFDDDTFYYGKKNLLDFANEIKKQKIKLPFSISVFGQMLSKEEIDALSEVGLYSVVVGIESGSKSVLQKRNSVLDLELVKNMVEDLKNNKVKSIAVFYFGLEYETNDSIDETINFALELDPDDAKFVLVVPSFGSRYYKELDKKGYILTKTIEDFYVSSKPSFRIDNMSREDLENALSKARKMWWAHKHIRNKEFDFDSMKNFFSFATGEHRIFFVVHNQCHLGHIHEIIYSLPESVQLIDINFIVPIGLKEAVKSEFQDSTIIDVDSDDIDPYKVFQKITYKRNDIYIIPSSSEKGKDCREIAEYFLDNFPESTFIISPKGRVIEKI